MNFKILIFLCSSALITHCFAETNPCLEEFCSLQTIDKSTVMNWHQLKVKMGPTFAGSQGWLQYMALIEEQADLFGMIDSKHNNFTYDRWHTSEWPDTSNWSLSVNGTAIPVSSYGPNSGNTDKEGIARDVILMEGQDFIELTNFDEVKGKILALKIHSTEFEKYRDDWIAETDSFTGKLGGSWNISESVHQDTVSQLFSANLDGSLPFNKPHYLKHIQQAKPAGVVLIFDMSNARANGLYGFPVPAIYDIPTLYLGRESGQQFEQSLQINNQAQLTLQAQVESTSAYQYSAFLPGKNYGKNNDEIILMISHNDGPSISQENGPLGLLSIVHYFNKIPQQQRDKTLMLFLDARHYIPNREAALPAYNVEKVLSANGALAPSHGKIVASVHLEHLGQIQFNEQGDRFEATSKMEEGGFYVTGYKGVVDISKQALLKHQPKNHVLRSTDIKGKNCQSQGHWFGLGNHPRKLGIEVIAANMAFMGAYWTTNTDLSFFNVDQFMRQVNTMTDITAGFMQQDINQLLSNKLTQSDPQLQCPR